MECRSDERYAPALTDAFDAARSLSHSCVGGLVIICARGTIRSFVRWLVGWLQVTVVTSELLLGLIINKKNNHKNSNSSSTSSRRGRGRKRGRRTRRERAAGKGMEATGWGKQDGMRGG